MNRSLKISLLVAVSGLWTLLPVVSSASGGRRGCGDSNCTSCVAEAPRYEDRVVTRYKCVTKERVVDEVVSRMVPHEEKYTYTVMVPVPTQEKRTVTHYTPQRREVDVKYTHMVPSTVKEVRRMAHFVPVTKVVDYTYFVSIPHTHKKIVKQTVYECQTRTVEDTVPVCRLVRREHVDECGRCYTTCERVTEMQKVTRCVVDRVPVTRDVETCETTYTREERKGQKTVCDVERRERDVEVCVVRYTPEERICKRTICEYVPHQREILVNVCHYRSEERTGVRTVYTCVKDTVKRTVAYTEMVPYQETIRVAVGGGCHTSSDCCDGGRRRLFGGLFHRNCD